MIARLTNGVGPRGKLHAMPDPPEPWTLDRYLALCGAIIRDVTSVEWDSRGPGDRCPTCSNLGA